MATSQRHNIIQYNKNVSIGGKKKGRTDQSEAENCAKLYDHLESIHTQIQPLKHHKKRKIHKIEGRRGDAQPRVAAENGTKACARFEFHLS